MRLLWMLGLAALVMMATACSRSQGEQVTVKEPPVQKQNKQIELDNINRLDSVYGLAWRSDEEMFSTTAPKWMGEELLHIHNTTTGADRQIGIKSGAWVNPSPDRKHVYIFNQSNGDTSIVSLPDEKRVSFHIGDTEYSNVNVGVEGAWLSNQYYVVATDQGLSLVDVQGKVTPLISIKEQETIVKVMTVPASSDEGRASIYYLNNGNKLNRLDVDTSHTVIPGTQRTELIRSDAADFAISLDGSRLALSIVTQENSNSVIVTTANDAERGSNVTTGRIVRQLSWSPDGSKLAFALFSLERTGTGLYVMNTQSGHLTLVSLYPNLQSNLVWSPGGNQLMMSVENMENNLNSPDSKLFTEIYRFKY